MKESLKEFAEVIKDLYLRGWLPATSGNFSLKVDDKSFFITSSGKHKGKISPKDFVLVDMEGNLLSGEGKPSAETLLHAVIYQCIPSARCVMHVHSPHATVFSKLVKDSKTRLQGYELLKAFEGIDTHDAELILPIFENSQDMPELAKRVKEELKGPSKYAGFLLRSHGVYVWAKDIQRALMKLEALEFILECELKLAIIYGGSTT
jgi:methylthioribulose-1-phosphate dehydratase